MKWGYLEQALAQGRVLVSEQSASNIWIRHLQKVKIRLQLHADTLLGQQ